MALDTTGLCFKGACHIDNSSEADVEATPDPFLCPFVGSTGPVYLKGNVYGPDPFEVYLPGMVFLLEHSFVSCNFSAC